jgi:TonB family protein
MRVLLAGPDHEENLSIRYLSAALRHAGHDTTLAAFNSRADLAAVAGAAEGVEIIGLSMCFQSRAMEFLNLARIIKSRDPRKLIVAGGHYASCAAEPLLTNHPEIDVIVIHEGEKTLVEIAEAMPHLEELLPQIPGIAYRDTQNRVRFTDRRPMLDNLDGLPFPDRRGPIHFLAGVPTSYLMGSRGCYGRCAYCCITTLHELATGKRFRQRDVKWIANEMAELYHERGTRQFVFHDDNFLVPSEAMNLARLSALATALDSLGVKDLALVMKCRPADASLAVLRRLKELGLVRIFLGVESATARGLSSLERQQTVRDSERALDACAELGISAQFTIMVFNPDATLETMRSDLAFMLRYCGNPLNFCRAEIYAGTPLEKRMIELGRARGDYLARVYDLSDPGADLACKISLDLFEYRCWSNSSLMQNAIGLDHLAAGAKRFYEGPVGAALAKRVGSWVRSVNLDTLSLLDEVLALSSSTPRGMDAGLKRATVALHDREAASRRKFLSDGSELRAELEALRFKNQASQLSPLPVPRLRLARQVAAALLAIGLPVTSGSYIVAGQEAKTTAPASSVAQQDLCSLSGTVTDSSGAVVPNATITVTNIDTVLSRTVITNKNGQYLASDLPIGRYTVKAKSLGFQENLKSGIALKKGDRERADFVLQVSAWAGCCEYAAAPLKTQAELINKKKPFTYYVGEADDHNTLSGVADLVYGDSKAWVPIFEANRKVIAKPGSTIPYGTAILIPAKKRVIPKLQFKPMPTYPPLALKQRIWGDVVLDVTLKDDGTVDRIGVVDGPPMLVEAATSAVKQWRYQPSPVKGGGVKFVVVVSFTKAGKVQ